jgi:uncharacterized protein YbjT (DUF2867 family)
MRIAVAGGTGQVGRGLSKLLEEQGHEVIVLARSTGVDLTTGDGANPALDDALQGTHAVVDVTNTTAQEQAETEAFFGTVASTLLAAEQRAGVAHHVLLSIVGIDLVPGNPHYAGKRRQEAVVEGGSVPWTIQRATQFFDFPVMVAGWTTTDGVAVVPPLLLQPVATADVVAVLAEHATGAPQGRAPDLAGPETHDMVDMVRRTFAARNDPTRLRASWRGGPFSLDMAGEVLLAGDDARLGPTTFDSWLDEGAPS